MGGLGDAVRLLGEAHRVATMPPRLHWPVPETARYRYAYVLMRTARTATDLRRIELCASLLGKIYDALYGRAALAPALFLHRDGDGFVLVGTEGVDHNDSASVSLRRDKHDP